MLFSSLACNNSALFNNSDGSRPIIKHGSRAASIKRKNKASLVTLREEKKSNRSIDLIEQGRSVYFLYVQTCVLLPCVSGLCHPLEDFT